MNYRRILLPAAVTALMLGSAATAQAEVEISANVALTSDYRFRGISQSNEDIAIQGGFDLAFDNGFYLGVWGSSVDFDSNDGLDGSLELDYYVGWSAPIGETDWSVDVGYLYYDYPGDEGQEGDYQEVYGSLSFRDLTVGVNYSDDYYAESDKFLYYYADYSFSLPADFGLAFHVGLNDLEEGGGYLATDEDSYIDYSVTLTKEWAAVEWSLAYIGTDLDEEDVFDTEWADDTLVFTVAKSF